MLPRKPDTNEVEPEVDSFEPDINDNTFEVVAINSHELNPKDFASCPEKANQPVEIPVCELGLNMAEEQDKDEKIFSLKTVLKQGEPSQAIKVRSC